MWHTSEIIIWARSVNGRSLFSADSRGHCNGLVNRQRFVALNQEVVDGSTSHDS